MSKAYLLTTETYKSQAETITVANTVYRGRNPVYSYDAETESVVKVRAGIPFIKVADLSKTNG